MSLSSSKSSTGPNPEDIQNLFASISEGYDKANDWMTFGMARLWRKKLVRWSGAQKGDHILDIATGTGDLALEFKKQVGSQGRVVGSDFCQEMLDKAPAKAQSLNLNVEFIWADAMNLPFKDQNFDVVSIAYGIRNVQDPVRVLKEMARVTRPGGQVLILETGDSQNPFIQSFYRFYFSNIVPLLGQWLTGKKQAYEYLNKSSSAFPSKKIFCEKMTSTGCFSEVKYKSLMGGASILYKGTVQA